MLGASKSIRGTVRGAMSGTLRPVWLKAAAGTAWRGRRGRGGAKHAGVPALEPAHHLPARTGTFGVGHACGRMVAWCPTHAVLFQSKASLLHMSTSHTLRDPAGSTGIHWKGGHTLSMAACFCLWQKCGKEA